MTTPTERTLNWRQTCALLGCSRSQFYNLINSGELPSHRNGRVKGIRVREVDAMAFMARGGTEGAEGVASNPRQNHV